MKAVKLPSGKWRARAYLYTDADGRKHTKSFTADTKREAERLAAAYDRGTQPVNMTVKDAVRGYIEAKESVLSPSTVRGYTSVYKTHIGGAFAVKHIDKLTQADVQMWVSSLARKVGAKTVQNAYGLLTATQKFWTGSSVQAKLPQKMRPKLYTPTDDDICTVLNAADPELRIAIMLGAFCGLRRGEICALTADDIDWDRGEVFVSRAIARTTTGYVVKPPKTEDSNRLVPIPSDVLSALPREGQFIESSPNAITARFLALVSRVGLPHFRFHDLRHYYATTLASIGMPVRIICDVGGWRTDKMMKRVYLGVKRDELEEQKKNAVNFFNGVISKKLPRSCHDDVHAVQKP